MAGEEVLGSDASQNSVLKIRPVHVPGTVGMDDEVAPAE